MRNDRLSINSVHAVCPALLQLWGKEGPEVPPARRHPPQWCEQSRRRQAESQIMRTAMPMPMIMRDCQRSTGNLSASLSTKVKPTLCATILTVSIDARTIQQSILTSDSLCSLTGNAVTVGYASSGPSGTASSAAAAGMGMADSMAAQRR
eukprot:TRINITY_DN106751_c0_g1_i1.p1 TRINITY_DN106751_c0_g1~~TRINITY_DN106751_c0_g1_i1.p1  ORF type:complete len:162 (-),score=4.92 TRINITY_DN106751_c0_g1_i1:70-519(-)